MQETNISKARVFRIEGNSYFVRPLEDLATLMRCSLKGKLKNDFSLKRDKLYTTDICVVGDIVDILTNADGTGVISKVDERNNQLSRKAPRIKGASYRGERLEQVIASNIDKLFVVMSFKNPEFNYKTLDRFLIAGESSGIETIAVFNKSDLFDEDSELWYDLYKSIGYKVISMSAKTGYGIEELEKEIHGSTCLFWGSSGVGKSSILNKLHPVLDLDTNEISEKTNRGKHTTVAVKMFTIGEDTHIIDTPGVREIEPYGIKKSDLGHYFLEFQEYISKCKYNSCTHNHEPGCGVIDALEAGELSEFRYDSYLRMLETTEDDMIFK